MNEANAQLYEKFTKLQWLLHKHQHRAQTENGPMADPSRGQGRILAILKLQDGISTKDLSYLLGIRVSSLNELLAKMEKGGYISREPSEADRRVILVKLTEKGKNEPQKKVNSDDVFECFSEDEKITLGEYLDRLIAALASDLEDEADESEREWWMRGARERMGDEMFRRFATGGFMGGAGERPGNFGDRPGNFGERPGNFGNRPGNFDERPKNFGERRGRFGDRPENFGHRPENLNKSTDHFNE